MPEMAQPGAGWIPPQYREFVTVPLTREEAERLFGTCGVSDELGRYRHYTVEEIQELFPRVTGVIDTRDGSYHPNQYFKA